MNIKIKYMVYYTLVVILATCVQGY